MAMHLSNVRLQNFKCFSDVTIQFAKEGKPPAKWCVIVGENGTGKSAVLQGIALGLMGPVSSQMFFGRYRLDGTNLAKIQAEQASPVATISLTLWDRARKVEVVRSADFAWDSEHQVDFLDTDTIGRFSDERALSRQQFAVGYGPMRRIAQPGDNPEDHYGYSPGDSFASLFHHREPLFFYDMLHSDALTSPNSALSKYQELLFRGLFPHDLRIDTRDDRLHFGKRVIPVSGLSDGYRAMFAIAGDILARLQEFCVDQGRQLKLTKEGCVQEEGIVLIDEIDAHLHPKWQQQIGSFLIRKFPKMQFIVSTHSPFIAQVAGGVVIHLQGGAAGTVLPDRRDFSGWRVEQTLSGLFGLNTTYDIETEMLIADYAECYMRIFKGQAEPSDHERFKQLDERLKAQFTTTDGGGKAAQLTGDYASLQISLRALLSQHSKVTSRSGK